MVQHAVPGLSVTEKLIPGSTSCCPGTGTLAPLPATQRMRWRERLQRTAALWPYMVPLVAVYFAEYAMQARINTSPKRPHAPKECKGSSASTCKGVLEQQHTGH